MNEYTARLKFRQWFVEMMADKVGDVLSVEETLMTCLNEMGIFEDVKIEAAEHAEQQFTDTRPDWQRSMLRTFLGGDTQ